MIKFIKKIVKKYKYKKLFPTCSIALSSNISNTCFLKLGKEVFIGNNCRIYPSKIANIVIGNNVFIAENTVIYTTYHKYENEDMLPFGYADLCSPVIIDDNVWIGSDCIILPGVKIEEGAVIAAGTVLTKSVPKGAVVAGNPGKILKFRNFEQYERVKQKGAHPSLSITPSSPEKKWILKEKMNEYLK